MLKGPVFMVYYMLQAQGVRWATLGPKCFLFGLFSRNFNIFSQSLPGEFSRNVQRTCFYGVLGAEAVYGSLGHPRTNVFCLTYFS